MDVNNYYQISKACKIMIIVFCMSLIWQQPAHTQELKTSTIETISAMPITIIETTVPLVIDIPSAYENAKFLEIVDTADKIEYSNEELVCLAKNIYYEARHESKVGKIAVAQVTINRTRDAKFASNTICGVVFAPHQFDWVRNKHTRLVTLKGSDWDDCIQVAKSAFEGARVKGIEHALYFHDTEVHPNWKHMVLVARIHTQLFYARA